MRRKSFKYIVPVMLTAMFGACSMGNNNEHDETFTVIADVALSENFETVEQGSWAVYESYQKDVYYFSATSDFELFYTTLTGNWTPPSIDFSQYRVIAIVDETQPTTGYSVEITSIKYKSGDQYRVIVHFTKPDGGVFTALTKPYHIVKVEISE